MNMLTVPILVAFVFGVVICDDDETMALHFLSHYGYISPTRSGNHDVPTAIRKFQEYFGLEISGVLDAPTISLMKKPRCGDPDDSGDGNRERRFATRGKWSKTHLSYYVQPGQDLSVDLQNQIFARALKYWADVSGLSFSEVSSASSADLKISFGSRSHSGTIVESTCPFPFDGPGGVLAHAYFPQDGRSHYDEDETFTHETAQGINLLWVATHEFGHSLGLLHTNVQGAVMYPYYRGYVPGMELHPDDIAGIQSLYGLNTGGGGGTEGCLRALGMESGAIPDAQVTASSMWDANHAPGQGRLNFQETAVKSGAWAARQLDDNQWLQVDLGTTGTIVRRIATQGRNDNGNWHSGAHSQWVSNYQLQYSKDGSNFQYYKEKGQANAKVFAGNTDRDTVVSHDLHPLIQARYIRFVPTQWHSHISMRVELYGCKLDMCVKALGMENGAISNNQTRASSMYDHNHAPGQGRLNFQETTVKSGAWATGINDVNQWLQIDLRRGYATVTRIATQGRNSNGQWPGGPSNQWVINYTLQYSVNGVNFDDYWDMERNTIQEFAGNTDRDTIITYYLDPPIAGRYIRFRPKRWNNHISMRVELYGC